MQENFLLMVELEVELVLWLLLGEAAGADTERTLAAKGGMEGAAGIGKETELVVLCRPHL